MGIQSHCSVRRGVLEARTSSPGKGWGVRPSIFRDQDHHLGYRTSVHQPLEPENHFQNDADRPGKASKLCILYHDQISDA